jgi:hypothetical protein
MYDKDADAMAGLHNPTGLAEFEVFTAAQYPDLNLEQGWYWDLPECRVDDATHPRISGVYQYANGPFETSIQAYDNAMKEG